MALCELQSTELFFAHLAFHPCFTGVVSVQSPLLLLWSVQLNVRQMSLQLTLVFNE